jgi:OOP family OmpA-OmpF porin
VIYLFEAGFGSEDAELRIEPILSFHPEMIVRRAVEVLKPPDSVKLEAANGALEAAGSAPSVWIAEFHAKAATIPGVDRFDDRRLVDDTARDLGELKRQIESQEVSFQVAEEDFAGQAEIMEKWARDLKSISALMGAPGSDRRAAVRVIGQTDGSGSERANLELSRRRARQVARILRENGIDTTGYEVIGIGENPIGGEEGASSQQSHRRVVIRLDFDGNSGSNPNK